MEMFLILAAGMIAQDVPASSGSSSATGSVSTTRKGKSDYVDLEAGVGYSSNPFLAIGAGTGRAYGRLSAHAVHNRWTERSTTSLSVYGENITYLGRYGSQLQGSVNAHHDVQMSELLKLFGDADASLDRSGQLGTRFISSASPLPNDVVTTPGLPFDPNVNVFAAGRTFRFSGQVGAQMTPSPRNSWTFRTGYSRSMFRNGVDDLTTADIFGSVAYSRRLDERTTVGAIVTGRQSDYDGPANVRSVTPQVTIHKNLSPRTTIDAAVGLSFVRFDSGTAVRNSTGLTASAAACHTGEKDQFCATFARDEQNSSIAGPAKSLSAGLSYGRQIDSRQSFQLSLSASRYSQQSQTFISPLAIGRSNYVAANATYSTKLRSRLYAGVNASARKLYRDGADPKPDVGGSIFLRFRLGDLG